MHLYAADDYAAFEEKEITSSDEVDVWLDHDFDAEYARRWADEGIGSNLADE